ncbi:PAS domain-containing protein [Streptomyces sp. Tu 2975]|uniref:sensor histidine kinase n=1 Tax=Streptomyces sp. Tu 2975 TaxID=2676871 RepID=UPI00135AE736|nr:ATP-binding protein [Streptomyces sp. Tu 2975]QIP84575.1 PAS domain-containing protein [Streptomyces sp. Tu 2975]
MRIPRPRSLAAQLFAMQVVLVAAIVAGCALFAYLTDRSQAEDSARLQSRATAAAAARSPSVSEAVRSKDPSAFLQPYAEGLRKDAGMDFVVIMDPQGRRWTHPEPDRIGRTYLGHIEPALDGRVYSEQYVGTLGLSVRTVAPVYDGGRVVALVSAGITVEEITEQVRDQVTALLAMAGAALVLGGAGTYVVNARLRRHTHGMNAAELGRMHDYHEAALHAVREGLVMLDGGRRIALANDGARELLGLGEDAVGRHVADLGLPRPLTGALLASEPRVDELHLSADRVVVVNSRPVVGGEQRGTVVTLRDHTELQALSGELDSERGFTQALRSQAHEAANRLHTVVSLIELGRADEAIVFATAELELAQALTDRVVDAVGEPVLAALLLGKAAQANERGVELALAEDSRIDDGVIPRSLPSRDLVTILGNLIDNAVDAASETGTGAPAAAPPLTSAPRSPEAPDEAPDADAATAPPVTAAPPASAVVPDPPAPVDSAAVVGPAVALPAARTAGESPARAVRARVTVTARVEDGELLLCVGDTGAGVDPDDAAEVFRRGWSTHGAGRGLGLALVQQAVHRGRGTIVLAQGPDGGAEFTVRLPLHPAEVPA